VSGEAGLGRRDFSKLETMPAQVRLLQIFQKRHVLLKAKAFGKSAEKFIFDQVKLERRRYELQLGIDQLNRGEGVPLDAKRINRAIDRKLKRTPTEVSYPLVVF